MFGETKQLLMLPLKLKHSYMFVFTKYCWHLGVAWSSDWSGGMMMMMMMMIMIMMIMATK